MNIRTFLSYFIPQTLWQTSSPHNRDIRVVELQGHNSLFIDGSCQSGPYIDRLWRSAFASFGIKSNIGFRRILVLGVGGGTVIARLAHLYPEAKITGVDIDSRVIEAGRDYFDLHESSTLKLIVSDAFAFVKKSARKASYDQIVVDIFTGRHIPEGVLDPAFLDSLKYLLSPKGSLLINYLTEEEYAKKSDVLYKLLVERFFAVRDYRIYRNRFFFAAKSG